MNKRIWLSPSHLSGQEEKYIHEAFDANWIAPLVIWLTKKDDSRKIDQHGKIVMNWLLTEFIYSIIFVLLCFVIVGIPLIIALSVVGIIFPIIGAVRANDGILFCAGCRN